MTVQLQNDQGLAPAGDPPKTARFGPFELDPRAGGLRKNGARIRLQDQPLRILGVLLENAGEVVTREELQRRLWPADTFVDFDHSLNTAIRKLRTALADSADAPRYVETEARKGYRFIAPVEWVTSETAAVPPPPLTARRSRLALWLVAAVVVAAIVAIANWLIRPPAPVHSIAVLPFTSEAPNAYVAEGVTQSVINDLSQIKGLRVMAWSTVSRYAGQTPHPRQVGSDLDVAAVVNGAVTRSGDQYRLVVEVIDVDDGAQIWGNRYERPVAELRLLQREVSSDVARRLIGGTTPAQVRTTSAEAYDLYLQGLYLWNRRTKPDVKKAIEYFQAAIEKDPNFAQAWAGLANAYGTMAGNEQEEPLDVQYRAKAAAEKALALDDTVAAAWASLAGGKSNFFWDFEGAERDFRRAIELNPGYATAHQWYSSHLFAMGRVDEAKRELDIALKLDPLSRGTCGAKSAHLFKSRRYDEMIAYVRHVHSIDPALANRGMIIRALLAQGKFEEGAREILGAEDAAEVLGDALPQMRAAYEQGGGKAFFEVGLKRLEEVSQNRYFSPLFLAGLHSVLGHREETFVWLERAYQQRAIIQFYTDPMFDNVRDDPRFTALAKRVGLPQVR